MSIFYSVRFVSLFALITFSESEISEVIGTFEKNTAKASLSLHGVNCCHETHKNFPFCT